MGSCGQVVVGRRLHFGGFVTIHCICSGEINWMFCHELYLLHLCNCFNISLVTLRVLKLREHYDKLHRGFEVHIDLHTDGSKMECGTGVYSSSLSINKSIKVDDSSTVFEAEVAGILTATTMVK